MQIQHFLMPIVDEREGMEGRGVAVSPRAFSGLSLVEGVLSRTVCESSDVIEGVDEAGGGDASCEEGTSCASS